MIKKTIQIYRATFNGLYEIFDYFQKLIKINDTKKSTKEIFEILNHLFG